MDMALHPSRPVPLPTGAKPRARWAALAKEAAEANAFYAPDMLGAAIDHLATDAHVRLIEARVGDHLMGCCRSWCSRAMAACRSAACPTGCTIIASLARR